MKVYEGAILTCDANDQVARYLVEDGGRILYVGDELPERYISVRHERLGKKALIRPSRTAIFTLRVFPHFMQD